MSQSKSNNIKISANIPSPYEYMLHAMAEVSQGSMARMKADTSAFTALMACKTPTEVFEVQCTYAQESIEIYSTTAARLLEVFSNPAALSTQQPKPRYDNIPV